MRAASTGAARGDEPDGIPGEQPAVMFPSTPEQEGRELLDMSPVSDALGQAFQDGGFRTEYGMPYAPSLGMLGHSHAHLASKLPYYQERAAHAMPFVPMMSPDWMPEAWQVPESTELLWAQHGRHQRRQPAQTKLHAGGNGRLQVTTHSRVSSNDSTKASESYQEEEGDVTVPPAVLPAGLREHLQPADLERLLATVDWSRLGTHDFPTVGSMGHYLGQCKPCAFAHDPNAGCNSGKGCSFCHLCAPGEKKRRRKEKKMQYNFARFQGQAAPMYMLHSHQPR
eukprot:TRINITY_DN13053_c0_g1_i1.p2 TRINITY_DN13053_c0_g1~~TRINITY_DN13053_c0_g1_i1.p2  ORF type:complete len:282 (-),score=39.57 TRINITY_DN13053_c0_g1_i1:678-1523(-)